MPSGPGMTRRMRHFLLAIAIASTACLSLPPPKPPAQARVCDDLAWIPAAIEAAR
jgi:hypothetical protein